jgi:hypothetical protein
MAHTQHDPEKRTSNFYPPSGISATHTRPLIDFVTNDRQQDDEEDEYYRRKSEDMHPRWQHMVAAPASRFAHIPRRVQRYAFIYVTLLLVAWFSWKRILQPNWESNRELNKALDESGKMFFGSNMRPEFSDMVHIKTMDSRLLPTNENSKQRLVVVGDVHGCKDERTPPYPSSNKQHFLMSA